MNPLDVAAEAAWIDAEMGEIVSFILVETGHLPTYEAAIRLRARIRKALMGASTPPDATGRPKGSCNCAHYGHAHLCPHHTQEDFEAADRAIGRVISPGSGDAS